MKGHCIYNGKKSREIKKKIKKTKNKYAGHVIWTKALHDTLA